MNENKTLKLLDWIRIISGKLLSIENFYSLTFLRVGGTASLLATCIRPCRNKKTVINKNISLKIKTFQLRNFINPLAFSALRSNMELIYSKASFLLKFYLSFCDLK